MSFKGFKKPEPKFYFVSIIVIAVGVGKGFCPEYEESQVKEIVRTYTDKLVPLKGLLAGILLVSEISSYGPPTERKFIKAKVSELFDPSS